MVEVSVWVAIIFGVLSIIAGAFVFLYNRDESLGNDTDNLEDRVSSNEKSIQRMHQTLHGEGQDSGLVEEIRSNHEQELELLEDGNRHMRMITFELINHRSALQELDEVELDEESIVLERNDFLRGGD